MKKSTNSVTIVVPVYGAWDAVSNCLDSIISYVDLERHRVVVANDLGPEAEVIERNVKQKIKPYTSSMTYVRNTKNLGFVENCNKAVKHARKSDHILLLNSDTELTAGSVETMVGLINTEDSIAVVSPRSNNATICTVPLYAMSTKGIKMKHSYRMHQSMKQRMDNYTVAPTSHGFCMMINRSALNDAGFLFDTAFGKGYGEEVDFCQRVRALGYRCVISNMSYVYHLEARSFSMEKKQALLEENNKIIRKRYPEYKNEVTNYIKTHTKLEHDQLTLVQKLAKLKYRAMLHIRKK